MTPEQIDEGSAEVWTSKMRLEPFLYNAFMHFIRQANGQIKALTTFTLNDGRTITAGTLGGIIASSRNLSQSGTAWVFFNGKIADNMLLQSAIMSIDSLN